MRLNDTSERVKVLLLKYPQYRDNDNKLIAHIMRDDMKKVLNKPPDYITGTEVLQLIADGSLTNTESIRRSRQKLQEHNPYLRGSKYKQKQASTTKFKQQLNELNTSNQTSLTIPNL